MKEEAISALSQVRDELRAAAQTRMEERMRIISEQEARS